MNTDALFVSGFLWMGRRHWWMGRQWPELGRGGLTISHEYPRRISVQDFCYSFLRVPAYIYMLYLYIFIAFSMKCWKHRSVFMCTMYNSIMVLILPHGNINVHPICQNMLFLLLHFNCSISINVRMTVWCTSTQLASNLFI